MSDFKEFQGKTLDEAISEACHYFNVEREKLELQIMNDAKSGIFGLVGAKKAMVQARRALAPGEELNEPKEKPKKAPASAKATTPQEKSKPRVAEKTTKKTAPKKSVIETADALVAKLDKEESLEKLADTAKSKKQPAKKLPKVSASKQTPVEEKNDDAGVDSLEDALEDENFRRVPFIDLETIGFEKTNAVVSVIIAKLIHPIVGEVPCEVIVEDARIRVTIDCDEETGILVGREGSTLAALQYLTTRMVARELGGPVRLQIDVGNYRERQDDRLKDLALFLGEKVKTNRRSQSTKPLSAYQRRIIHLALEEDEELQTHSKGEGAHRRVIIQLRRTGGQGKRRQAPREQEDVVEGNEPDSQLDFALGHD